MNTSARLLGTITPAPLVVRELFQDEPGAVEALHPEEAALVACAVAKRRREFAGARWCAHGALAELGVPYAPLLPGPGGAPRWPAGTVGSLTHSGSYRAAAVARAADFLALGIDAEANAPLPPGLLDLVAVEREHGWAGAEPASGAPVWPDRLLFSIKESIYKAWFPLTGRQLGFQSATVMLEGTAGSGGAFEVRIAGERELLHGRWALGRRLLVTAVAVPAPGLRTQGLSDRP